MIFINNFTKLIYCFSMIIPLSSKPVILALVPTGSSSGVEISGINPEILNLALSN